MKKITILGTGAYGIALALMFHENDTQITMWTKFKEEAEMLRKERCHQKVLPTIMLPTDIEITTDLKMALENTSLVVLVTPAQVVDGVMEDVKKYVTGEECFLVASKGIDIKSTSFVHEIVLRHIETEKMGALSGPTFAIDLASKVPSALTLATGSKKLKELVLETLPNSYLKIECIRDILGTEICGSIKNIMAIISGMLTGMGYPISTSAMFITDALKEIQSLINILGGDSNAVLSYAGIGDLLLTCMSEKSRNFRLGKLFGEGKDKEEIDAYIESTTIEGLYTLEAIQSLLEREKIDMPLADILYKVIHYEEKPTFLLDFLMKKV